MKPGTGTHALIQALRTAHRVPDPQRTSSPVRVYGPDGALRETVTPHDWDTRYPHRFTRRLRGWGRFGRV